MNTILSYMTGVHGHCDELFAVAEQSVAKKNWPDAMSAFEAFIEASNKHFATEEEVLFPRLEQRMGHAGGPTQVMRMEHAQMQSLFDSLAAQLQSESQEEFLGGAETLLILMQQHNMKEEQILYPMADQLLAAERGAVIEAIENYQ